MSGWQPPERLNAAEVLVDAHLAQGRAEKTAILSGERAISYRQLAEAVNRFGHALLELGVRMEERVAFVLPDSPEWAYVFFGTIKMGGVAIPLNTLLTSKDYEYLLNDCRARVLVLHASLMDRIGPIRDRLRHLDHVIVVGGPPAWELGFDALMERAHPCLEPADDTVRDDVAFWLYSSGTTGVPKGAIHLQHDMLVAADAYARDTIDLRTSDVSFSVARLFFAYGLGNGLYFPLRTGGTTVLMPERPTPDRVFQTIDTYQPTVFYGVPTS